MTILITGSSGHLGQGLIRTLRSQDRDCAGLDMLPSQWTDHVGSIADLEVCRKAVASSGAKSIIHCATLHKPHVATHSRQQFIDTNITGTQNLLDAAVEFGVERFVFISTTSAFGSSLIPATSDAPAIWIDETVPSSPKNIYGATKTAAENLCLLMHRLYEMPVVILRVSRFFPDIDNDPKTRAFCPDDRNAKVNELVFRRADVADMVSACLKALERAETLKFAKLLIAAGTPFQKSDLAELRRNAPAVLERYMPQYRKVYEKMDWRFFKSLDRVYDNTAAKKALGWTPYFTFERVLQRINDGQSPFSDLHHQVLRTASSMEFFAKIFPRALVKPEHEYRLCRGEPQLEPVKPEHEYRGLCRGESQLEPEHVL